MITTRGVTKSLLIALCSIGLLAGCAATKPKSDSAIAEAKAAIAKNQSVQWIWRDTEKMLKQAEEAAAKGEQEKATALANEARLQAELALEQYYHERSTNRDLIQ